MTAVDACLIDHRGHCELTSTGTRHHSGSEFAHPVEAVQYLRATVKLRARRISMCDVNRRDALCIKIANMFALALRTVHLYSDDAD